MKPKLIVLVTGNKENVFQPLRRLEKTVYKLVKVLVSSHPRDWALANS